MITTYRFNIIKNVEDDFDITMPEGFASITTPTARITTATIMGLTGVAPTFATEFPASAYTITTATSVNASPPTTLARGGSGGGTVYAVGASACWLNASAFSSTTTPNFMLGNSYGTPYIIWLPFVITDANITQGKAIVSATLSIVCSSVRAGDLSIKVGCDDRDNANVAPVDYNDLVTRTQTSMTTTDYLEATVIQGNTYIFELQSGAQQVINRAGWASGQTIAVLIKDNSNNNASHYFAGYANGTYTAPTLILTY
jgi:hypothetical protein